MADEGPGIAPEERERVFEMFSQNSGGGRSGLGLAIAKAFVEAHGGTIWIDPGVDARCTCASSPFPRRRTWRSMRERERAA